MDTWKNYGYSKTSYFAGVQEMIDIVNGLDRKDMVMLNPHSGSYIMLKERGDIEYMAGDMLGIKIIRKNNSINMFADSINAKGDIEFASTDNKDSNTFASPQDIAKLSMRGTEKKITLAAKNIDLMSSRDGKLNVGTGNAYMNIENDSVTISGRSIYLNSNRIYIPEEADFIRI